MDFLLLGSLRFDQNIRAAAWNSAANGETSSPYLLLPYVVDRFASAIKVHSWPESNLHHVYYLCDKAVQGVDGPQKVTMLLQVPDLH